MWKSACAGKGEVFDVAGTSERRPVVEEEQEARDIEVDPSNVKGDDPSTYGHLHARVAMDHFSVPSTWVQVGSDNAWQAQTRFPFRS